MLGLDNRWAYNISKQVGNYAESFERHLTPLGVDRSVNKPQLDHRECEGSLAGRNERIISGATFTENSEQAFYASLSSLHSQKPLARLRVQLR